VLSNKVLTLHDHEVSAWRIHMSIPEHEIHCCGQISSYLQMNKIEQPQTFGLKIEAVHLYNFMQELWTSSSIQSLFLSS